MTNSRNLSGKVALVTGAAKRIGATICRHLHADGANIVIHYRGSADEANALCDELNSERLESAIMLQADLADSAAIDDLVAAAGKWRNSLDILINNASSFYPTPIGEITEASWDDLVGTNLKAPLFLSQAAAPLLRDSRGAIINIVDIHSQRPLRDHAVYGSAKAGLAMLTRALAKDLAPEIRVNGVSPGAIMWPENESNDIAHQRIVSQTPLKRIGSPGDIASAVLFLATESFINGQVISIDGGRSVSIT